MMKKIIIAFSSVVIVAIGLASTVLADEKYEPQTTAASYYEGGEIRLPDKNEKVEINEAEIAAYLGFAEAAYDRENILPEDSEEIQAKKLEKNAYIDEVEKVCENYVEKSRMGELTNKDSDILIEQLNALREKIEDCDFESDYRLSFLPQNVLGYKSSAEEAYMWLDNQHGKNKNKDVVAFYKEYLRVCDDLYHRLMDGETSYEDGQKEFDEKIKPEWERLSYCLHQNEYLEEFNPYGGSLEN